MDRRKLLVTSLSSLLAYKCGCANAQEKEAIEGCRMLGLGGALLKNRMRTSTGEEMVDRFCIRWHGLITKEFGLKPGFSFIDDGQHPNAFATPEVLIPTGPDGTVMLGTALVKHEVGEVKADDDLKVFASIIIILAHECGHILQYKRGMKPSGPWQMEPHADFLAGWAIARLKPKMNTLGIFNLRHNEWAQDQEAVEAIFTRGDTLFNDKEHHGQPEFRAAMVMAGADLKRLSVEKAYEKGMRMAGIRAR